MTKDKEKKVRIEYLTHHQRIANVFKLVEQWSVGGDDERRRSHVGHVGHVGRVGDFNTRTQGDGGLYE